MAPISEIDASGPAACHAISLPNRPLGLAPAGRSIMTMYISPSVNSGKPMVPKLRIRPSTIAATSAPRDRAHAADHGDDEATRSGWRSPCPASASAPARPAPRPAPASTPPTREHQRVEQGGVDAERRDHLRVDRGRAHDLADPRQSIRPARAPARSATRRRSATT